MYIFSENKRRKNTHNVNITLVSWYHTNKADKHSLLKNPSKGNKTIWLGKEKKRKLTIESWVFILKSCIEAQLIVLERVSLDRNQWKQTKQLCCLFAECECLAGLAIPDKIPKCPQTRLSNSSSNYLTLKIKTLLRGMQSSVWWLNVNQSCFSSLNELRRLREIVFGVRLLFPYF